MKAENGDTKTTTPKTPKKRDADTASGDEAGTGSASPSKKAKRTPKSKIVKAAAEEDGEGVKQELTEDGAEV